MRKHWPVFITITWCLLFQRWKDDYLTWNPEDYGGVCSVKMSHEKNLGSWCYVVQHVSLSWAVLLGWPTCLYALWSFNCAASKKSFIGTYWLKRSCSVLIWKQELVYFGNKDNVWSIFTKSCVLQIHINLSTSTVEKMLYLWCFLRIFHFHFLRQQMEKKINSKLCLEMVILNSSFVENWQKAFILFVLKASFKLVFGLLNEIYTEMVSLSFMTHHLFWSFPIKKYL